VAIGRKRAWSESQLEGLPVAKTEWGQKRACQHCGASYYDLRRSPVVCPKCGTKYAPEAFSKARRARVPVGVPEEAPAPSPVEAEVETVEEGEVADEDEDQEEVAEKEVGAEEEDLIEDPSELGEDKDDMAEVLDHVEGNEDEKA
jgi:uncharacterized protein (TIGR02300 family)